MIVLDNDVLGYREQTQSCSALNLFRGRPLNSWDAQKRLRAGWGLVLPSSGQDNPPEAQEMNMKTVAEQPSGLRVRWVEP